MVLGVFVRLMSGETGRDVGGEVATSIFGNDAG